MKCLRTLGVLLVTLSLVWSKALETTSPRYQQSDDHNFKLSLDINSTALSSILLNLSSHLNYSIGNNRYADNISTSLVLGDAVEFGNKKINSSLMESRNVKSISKQNKDHLVNNFIKTTIKDLKQNITKTTEKRISSTTKKNTKQKLSTYAPIVIKLTKRTTEKPQVSTPKSYSKNTTRKSPIKLKVTTSASKKKTKPTIKRISTKWKDTINDTLGFKQNWYEEGVPYPNPMPQITSSSPPFSVSDSGLSEISSSSTENIYLFNDNLRPEIYSNSPSEPLQGVPPILPLSEEQDLESIAIPSANNGNPISTFNLDMLPSTELTKDSAGNPCPTVHISSSVLSPLQRQDCSDLNLVLNTHYHQNQDTRVPSVSTYDATAPVEEDPAVEPVLSDDLANAGPTGGVASDSVPSTNAGSAVPGGSGGSSTGGSGGSGGSGGDGGGNDGFKLPDLKPMFRALGYLMRGLWWLIQKLMNPWLYIIPIVIFFKLGFLGILTLFPWWIPLVFLYFSVRTEEPKNTVSHVKHHHKPIVIKHEDGWYWDQRTNTWKNVEHAHRHRRYIINEEVEDMVDEKIIRFGERYFKEGEKKAKRK